MGAIGILGLGLLVHSQDDGSGVGRLLGFVVRLLEMDGSGFDGLSLECLGNLALSAHDA